MRRSLLLLVVPALLVVGCKNRESQAVGTWQAGGQNLELKADKTWAQTGAIAVAGTWTFTDPKVDLTVKTINGQDPKELIKKLKASPMAAALGGDKLQKGLDQIEKPIPATLSEDGKTLTITNPMTGAPETLTKADASK